MISIYDPTTDTYTALDDYLAAQGDVDQTVDVIIRLLYNITELRELSMKQSALRGKYAQTEGGESLLQVYTITVDDEDTILGFFKQASGDVQKKLAGWARDLKEAYQFNVEVSDETLDETGTLTGNTASPLVTVVDSSKSWEINEHAGSTFELTSTVNLESMTGLTELSVRIISNTDTQLTVESTSLPGLQAGAMLDDYKIYKPDFILFFITLRENSQFDLLKTIDEDIANAIFTAGVKEWFLLNNIPAYELEAANYATFIDNVRSNMLNINLPVKTNRYPQT